MHIVKSIFGTIWYMFIGLMIGALFSDYITMNLTTTQWTNLWTWGWILLWPFFVFFKFIWYGMIFVVIAIIAMVVWDKWFSR